MVSLSYFCSVETLYSNIRFVSAVIVSFNVLELFDLPLLPLISTSSPSSVVTFHFLVLLDEPGSVSAMSGSPVKKSSNVLLAASADAGSMLASISSTSSRDRSFFFIACLIPPKLHVLRSLEALFLIKKANVIHAENMLPYGIFVGLRFFR